jgi:hypothetical protein
MLLVEMFSIEEGQTKGQWFKRTLWGQTIEFKIRPYTNEISKTIRNRFCTLREGKPKEDDIFNDVVDYILEDFKGIGEEDPDGTVKVMPVTLENKKKVLQMAVPIGEDLNLAWVFDKANGLCFKFIEDKQGQ